MNNTKYLQIGIRSEYQRIQKEIEALQEEIFVIRKRCEHPNTKKEEKGSCGNYDPSDDKYWYIFTCLDCEHSWTEPQ